MASEYELPPNSPELDIVHIKRLSLYVTSDDDMPASSLKFNILGYTVEDRDETGGTIVPAGQFPQAEIDAFIDDPGLGAPSLVRTSPLDFAIQKKCFITLRLVGDFWRFSAVRPGVTTKSRHADSRYYGLVPHSRNGVIKAITFCAKTPREASNGAYVRHGINFYVDFMQDGMILPVIIDPDIENKGGNN